MKKIKLALFHPWIKSRGGAERVLLEILKNKYLDVDLYTWIYDARNTFDDFKKYKINVLSSKFMDKFSRFYVLRGLFLFSSLFSKIFLEKYDFFLVSTSGVGEFILFRNYKPNKTIAYVHTTLRATNKEDVEWNLKNRYKNFLSKGLYLISVKIYSFLEALAWKRIDFPIFNSMLSYERAKKRKLVENKKTDIIYPPISFYDKIDSIKIKNQGFFLYVSRFNKSKRQDLLLKAWNSFSQDNSENRLILAGNIDDNKYFNKIKNMASKMKNVEIILNASDDGLKNLYSNCLAGIFIPFKEDFGIVPFEFLAFGKPLILIKDGFYSEIIKKNPQVIYINESKNEGDIIKQLKEGMSILAKKKIKSKKIFFKELFSDNFNKKLTHIFKKEMYGL